MSIQCDVERSRASECSLNRGGGTLSSPDHLKELRWRKEDALSFRLRGAASDVHFQSKSRKVVVDQFHSALHVLSRAERECAIINIEALQYFICGEFL